MYLVLSNNECQPCVAADTVLMWSCLEDFCDPGGRRGSWGLGMPHAIQKLGDLSSWVFSFGLLFQQLRALIEQVVQKLMCILQHRHSVNLLLSKVNSSKKGACSERAYLFDPTANVGNNNGHVFALSNCQGPTWCM